MKSVNGFLGRRSLSVVHNIELKNSEPSAFHPVCVCPCRLLGWTYNKMLFCSDPQQDSAAVVGGSEKIIKFDSFMVGNLETRP
jgi:hypothetical protein